jgi:hypothetical protein
MNTILNITKPLSRTLLLAPLLIATALSFSMPARAGGPLEVCEPGVPYLCPNGGQNVPFRQNVPFNPDQGALGILDSASAVPAVTDAFQVWGDVPTATINYSNQDILPVDVDISNFTPFLQATVPDGL